MDDNWQISKDANARTPNVPPKCETVDRDSR